MISSRTHEIYFTTTPFTYKTKQGTEEPDNLPQGERNPIWTEYHRTTTRQTELLLEDQADSFPLWLYSLLR